MNGAETKGQEGQEGVPRLELLAKRLESMAGGAEEISRVVEKRIDEIMGSTPSEDCEKAASPEGACLIDRCDLAVERIERALRSTVRDFTRL
jgi:hypothetical protein